MAGVQDYVQGQCVCGMFDDRCYVNQCRMLQRYRNEDRAGLVGRTMTIRGAGSVRSRFLEQE